MPALALFGLLFVARSSFANHYVVPSGSMEPTLRPGDRVVVDMSAYGLRIPYTETVVLERGRPQRGDVVLLPSPATGDRLIKRIVGVAGDRVTLQDGRLSIDGVPAAVGDGRGERVGAHAVPLNLAYGGGPDIDVVVPRGHVLVVGDNRGNSLDGRMFGFVRESAVYAKARGVFWRSGERFTWKPL
jgi:signal peptidase I